MGGGGEGGRAGNGSSLSPGVQTQPPVLTPCEGRAPVNDGTLLVFRAGCEQRGARRGH